MADYFIIPENINSFEDINIPLNITHVDCSNRHFTNFIGCPDHITQLFCSNNPCYPIYQELGLNCIHEHNNILEIKELKYY